jgi:hypothetical protein
MQEKVEAFGKSITGAMASGNIPDPEINKVSFDDKQEKKAGDTSHAAGVESGKVPDPEINKVRLDDKEGKKVDQESSEKGPLKKVCAHSWKFHLLTARIGS